MAATEDTVSLNDDELLEATLIFREQADGRRVARLPQGKVVLVAAAEVDRVKNGDQWHVRLRQRDTFAIADLVDRVPLPEINPVLSADLAKLIHTRPASETAAKVPAPAKPLIVPRPSIQRRLSQPGRLSSRHCLSRSASTLARRGDERPRGDVHRWRQHGPGVPHGGLFH